MGCAGMTVWKNQQTILQRNDLVLTGGARKLPPVSDVERLGLSKVHVLVGSYSFSFYNRWQSQVQKKIERWKRATGTDLATR